jgi:hypothetical protein
MSVPPWDETGSSFGIRKVIAATDELHVVLTNVVGYQSGLSFYLEIRTSIERVNSSVRRAMLGLESYVKPLVEISGLATTLLTQTVAPEGHAVPVVPLHGSARPHRLDMQWWVALPSDCLSLFLEFRILHRRPVPLEAIAFDCTMLENARQESLPWP